jgi:hypothetical protein
MNDSSQPNRGIGKLIGVCAFTLTTLEESEAGVRDKRPQFIVTIFG